MSLDLRLTDHERKLLEHTVVVRKRLEDQYANLQQENETAALGMWLFLATEIMFFGTLFTALFIYRLLYPAAFERASVHLNWQIGATNTVVLLISSLLMALAVFCVRTGTGQTRRTVLLLLFTAVLGAIFLALKAYEYYDDIRQGLVLGQRFNAEPWLNEGLARGELPRAQLFLLLYWVMTGAHAVHMVIGISVVLVIAVLASQDRFDADYYGPVEVTGLYWHFVDVVWIFLFPALYLLGTHGR